MTYLGRKRFRKGDLFIICFLGVWHSVVGNLQHYNNSHNKCALPVKLDSCSSNITG